MTKGCPEDVFRRQTSACVPAVPGMQRGSRDSSDEDPQSPAGAGDGHGLIKRQRRLQEKNRSAQKRYRERQVLTRGHHACIPSRA